MPYIFLYFFMIVFIFCELDNLVERFLEEFDLNTITLVGALTEKTKELLEVGSIEFEMDDAFFDDDDEEEEDF